MQAEMGDTGRVGGWYSTIAPEADRGEGVLDEKEVFLRARDAFGPGPDGSIGLQAYQIRVGGPCEPCQRPLWRQT